MIQKILNYLKKLIPIDLDSMVLESSENESNVYQKYGVAAAAGTAVALFSLFIMAFLIATGDCLLYTSPSPRDRTRSRMPSSA